MIFTRFLDFPWGLVFLLFIGLLAYFEKIPGLLSSFGVRRNIFLFFVLLLLATTFLPLPTFFLGEGIYVNLGGLISLVFAVYLLSKLKTIERVRSLIACIFIFALTFASTSGVLWRIEEVFPYLYYLLPIFLAFIAIIIVGDAIGSIASLILGVWLSDALSIILFRSLQSFEVAGIRTLNLWLIATFFLFIIIFFKEFAQNRKTSKGTSA
ncbi:MAG: hypothetical protein ACOX7H_05825 [Bacillota bacterium]|jgi:hypothetical protein